ncbi:hypothetical protein C8F04DRAFT_935867 [Mycena alexandri]|uniref:VASt domain-containing protein n=1 Tax=Mycena alexandri TaxID=1745969 RepID=A0AAD6TPF7_9AGAR|nr:hypothetical protein C8F04DRAFT_935867 [Mycena alexandri]
MAPNFLSKLVKSQSPTQTTRDRSLSSPSPPSPPVSRSRTPSSVDQSVSSRNTSAFTNANSPVPSVTVNSGKPFASANPSVTVIPPTPVGSTGSVPAIPVRTNGRDGLPHSYDEERTPTPDRPPVPGKPVPAPPVIPRPPTPKSSPKASPQMPTKDLPSVRRQGSNKSLKGQQPQEHALAPPLPITAHSRAATSPALRSPDDGEAPIPFVESPTQQDFPSASTSWASRSPSRRDTEVSKKPTSRPWRRSAPKKPMGLAGAIAASGLAMANPGMTAPQQSTLSPQVMNTNENRSSPSLVTSPISNPNRKLTASPEAIVHRRHRSGSNGKSPRTEHKRRRTTGSMVGHGSAEGEYLEDHEYYSGLEESDEDGSGSDSSDESGSGLEDLDLGEDDIPVTGFAVASNKRNADFHDLFPGIPEGDYLIDDYGCALQREILIQGRIYVSENHICFHANIFGWVTDLTIAIYEITTLEKRMTAFVIPNAIRIKTPRADYTFASFLSRDTTFDVIHNIWRLARPGDATSIGSGSGGEHTVNIAEGTIIGAAAGSSGQGPVRKATSCACGKEGKHYTDTALDIVIPGTPERIYNLMFASGFMKEFMAVNQKLTDIQVSDWAPTTTGSKLLARNMSYIKPLYGSLGPKQTKCEIRDETVHADFDDYVSTVTTTRTPDVPSGGVFSVKTRTCITWASPFSTRVVVTTQIDWTGRSFIKGIIERSAIEGQMTYHKDLDKAMRAYIQEHQSEFMPEGVDTAQVLAEVTAEATPTTPVSSGAVTEQEREKERGQRGLQWAWDTFDGAYQVAKQSTKGLLEIIRDGWEHSTSTTILYFVIALLITTNLWTYMRPVNKGKRKDKYIAKDKLAGVVTALWDEIAAGKLAVTGPAAEPVLVLSPPVAGVPLDAESLKLELSTLHTTLDAVEERVRLIRESLKELQPQSINQMD